MLLMLHNILHDNVLRRYFKLLFQCFFIFLIWPNLFAEALDKLSETTKAFTHGDTSLKDGLVQTLQGILDLYPNHIWKEEYLLYPMTDKILNFKQQEELAEGFEGVENQLGKDTHSHFEKLAQEVERKVRQIK